MFLVIVRGDESRRLHAHADCQRNGLPGAHAFMPRHDEAGDDAERYL